MENGSISANSIDILNLTMQC